VIEGVEIHDLKIDTDDHVHTGKTPSTMVSANTDATREQFLEMFVFNDNLNSMNNNVGEDMSTAKISTDESGLRHAVLFVNDLSGNIRHYENPENPQNKSFQICLPIKQ